MEPFWWPAISLVAWAGLIICMPPPLRVPSATPLIILAALGVIIGVLTIPYGLRAPVCLLVVVAGTWAYRASAKQDADVSDIQEKLERVHDPFRSELKARARKTSGRLSRFVEFTELFLTLSAEDPSNKQHQASWHANDIRLMNTYQEEFENIRRLFVDFALCSIEEPETRHVAEDPFLKLPGIKRVADCLLAMSDKI